MLGSLHCHCPPPYSLETGSFPEPGARLVASKPQLSSMSTPHSTWGYSQVWLLKFKLGSSHTASILPSEPSPSPDVSHLQILNFSSCSVICILFSDMAQRLCECVCVYVCVCMCECAHLYERACLCVHIWRPEADSGFSSVTLHLVFESGSLTGSRLVGQQGPGI